MSVFRVETDQGTFDVEVEGNEPPSMEDIQRFAQQQTQPPETPANEFTTGEKIFAGALPIIGGIGGGIMGVPAGLPGIAAGGALGAAGGRGLADIFEAYAGGENRTAKEIGRRAVKEGAVDVAFTLGTAGIGKVAKPLLKPIGKRITKGLMKASAPVRQAEKFRKIIRKVDSLNSVLNNKLRRSKVLLDKRKAARAIGVGAKERALRTQLDDAIVKTAPVLEEGLDKSFKAVSQGYNELKLPGIGDQPLNLAGVKESLDNIIKSGGLESFDAGGLSKISKISKILDAGVSIPEDIARSIGGLPPVAQAQALEQLGLSGTTKVLNVADGITIRREMADILRGLRKGSPTAKNVIAPEFEKVLKAVDEPLDILTSGKLNILNDRWRELASIEDISKGALGLFRTELVKPTKAQLTKRARRITGALKSLSAKDLDTSAGVLKPATDRVGNLIEQANALKMTGVPALADEGADALKNIHDIAFKTVKLDDLKKPLKTAKLEARFRAIKNEVLNNESYVNGLRDRAMNLERTIGTSRDLMSLFIAGRSIGSIPGLPTLLKNSLRGIINIFSFSKWSPTAAATVLDEIRNLSPVIAKAKLSPTARRIANRLLAEMTFGLSEQ